MEKNNNNNNKIKNKNYEDITPFKGGRICCLYWYIVYVVSIIFNFNWFLGIYGAVKLCRNRKIKNKNKKL